MPSEHYDIKVSVIVPVYNAADTLGRCAESILGQTLKSLELIVVDNNSTDSGIEFIKHCARRDPRIKAVPCLKQGPNAARNAGMDAAEGEFIFFADADDHLDAGLLEWLVKSAEENRANAVLPAMRHIYMGKDGKVRKVTKSALPERAYVGRDTIARAFASALPSRAFYGVFWLYRSDFLKGACARFDEEQSLGGGLMFNMQILEHLERMYAVTAPFYNKVHREGSYSTLYRPDLPKIQADLRAAAVRYLEQSGVWNDEARELVLANDADDLMACAANALKTLALASAEPAAKRARKLLTHLIEQGRGTGPAELYNKRIKGKIGTRRRLFMFAVRHKIYFIIRALSSGK